MSEKQSKLTPLSKLASKMRCPKCKITGDEHFYPSTLKRSGHNRKCRKCHSDDTNKYRRLHPEYQAAYAKLYRDRRPHYFKDYRSWYAKKYRTLVLDYYGAICACCGEKEERFLTVDHVNNDGYKHRKRNGDRIGGTTLYLFAVKNGFPASLQILCWNCNCGKRMNGGVCPHKKYATQG